MTRLQDGRFGVPITAGVNNDLFSKTAKSFMVPRQPSIQSVPGFFAGIKVSECKGDHSYSSIVKDMNECRCTPTPNLFIYSDQPN